MQYPDPEGAIERSRSLLHPEPTNRDVMAALRHTQVMISAIEPLTAETVRDAVSDGVKAAVADPAMWSAAYNAMQERAQKEAGGWVLGGIKALLSRAGWLVLAGAAIYMLGGWAGVLAFLKTGGGGR